MDIKNLRSVLKTMRTYGCAKLSTPELTLELGDLPITSQSAVQGDIEHSQYENFPQGALSPEQLMYYSAGGDPEHDPENK
jgi:hypothetical protein